jgi:hypothetical protein
VRTFDVEQKAWRSELAPFPHTIDGGNGVIARIDLRVHSECAHTHTHTHMHTRTFPALHTYFDAREQICMVLKPVFAALDACRIESLAPHELCAKAQPSEAANGTDHASALLTPWSVQPQVLCAWDGEHANALERVHARTDTPRISALSKTGQERWQQLQQRPWSTRGH